MFPRLILPRLQAALSDTRVVLLSGPRQVGKTTLAQSLTPTGRSYVTLDDRTTLQAAQRDPVGFVRSLDRATIDEIQRAPDLLVAIKQAVDQDPRPGRFLLTGSANILTLPTVADSLAGRMEVLRLSPLAQAEMRSARPPGFLDRAFGGEPPRSEQAVIGGALVEAVLTGGYPEAVSRKTWNRRADWARSYIDALIQRDVRDISGITKLDQLPRLIRALAEQSAQLTNFNALGGRLGLSDVTTRTYTTVLEQLYLVKTLPAWHSNALKRLVKTPKLHFVDTGLLAATRALTPQKVAQDRTPFGAVLESFVFNEIDRISEWSDRRLLFSHYRDKDGAEVDLVIEDEAGAVIGVEVKASASVDSSDFNGLRRLSAALGERFVQGLVLYDHDQVAPFGDRLWAAPISGLWG